MKSSIKKDTPLNDILRLGESCRKCGSCCKYGSGFLDEKDIKNIAHFLSVEEEKLKKEFLKEIDKFNTKRFRPKLIKKGKPYGACIFLNKEGRCRIQDVKPIQCRIGNCGKQGEELSAWFTLNYFVDPKDPESIRQFYIYLKSGGKTLPGGELKDFVKNKKELDSIMSYEDLK